MIVELDIAEQLHAASVGVRRNIQSIRRGALPKWGQGGAALWGSHIEGAAGELAVAKATNTYWNGALGDYDADDVGGLQIRTTPHPNGCLILHPSDPDDRPFILVIGTMPFFRLAGWMMGRDGKDPKWWRAGIDRPAFFVPQADLRPMEELLSDGPQGNPIRSTANDPGDGYHPPGKEA
jgi:hypothetical protein